MDKKKLVSIIVLVIGIITLGVGVVFLVLHLTKGPAVADGEYLVSKGKWVLEGDCAKAKDGGDKQDCESGVIWDFTEVGKGSLTTNNHMNDYDFAWALKDEQLVVRTDWLYELNNSYDYELDQGAGVLTLTSGEETYRFLAQSE